MKMKVVLGAVLLVIGILALASEGIDYSVEAARIESLEPISQDAATADLFPRLMACIALVTGMGLVLVDVRNQS